MFADQSKWLTLLAMLVMVIQSGCAPMVGVRYHGHGGGKIGDVPVGVIGSQPSEADISVQAKGSPPLPAIPARLAMLWSRWSSGPPHPACGGGEEEPIAPHSRFHPVPVRPVFSPPGVAAQGLPPELLPDASTRASF